MKGRKRVMDRRHYSNPFRKFLTLLVLVPLFIKYFYFSIRLCCIAPVLAAKVCSEG